MIDETVKLDELELLSNKFTELNLYFLNKIVIKDISENDKERFGYIVGEFSLKMYEYAKTKSSSKEELKSSVSFQIEKLEDNIKNS